jgi:hypothetical protein
MRVILHICCQIQDTISGLRYANSGPRQIQYSYGPSYAGFNIQFNVWTIPLQMYGQFDARYTPHLLRNKARILLFTLCQIWSR